MRGSQAKPSISWVQRVLRNENLGVASADSQRCSVPCSGLQLWPIEVRLDPESLSPLCCPLRKKKKIENYLCIEKADLFGFIDNNILAIPNQSSNWAAGSDQCWSTSTCLCVSSCSLELLTTMSHKPFYRHFKITTSFFLTSEEKPYSRAS